MSLCFAYVFRKRKTHDVLLWIGSIVAAVCFCSGISKSNFCSTIGPGNFLITNNVRSLYKQWSIYVYLIFGVLTQYLYFYIKHRAGVVSILARDSRVWISVLGSEQWVNRYPEVAGSIPAQTQTLKNFQSISVKSVEWKVKKKSLTDLLREAAKKVLFLVARPLVTGHCIFFKFHYLI